MSTVHFSQITEPELLDIVDDAWLQDKLPDDSEQLGLPMLFAWCCLTLHSAAVSMCFGMSSCFGCVCIPQAGYTW